MAQHMKQLGMFEEAARAKTPKKRVVAQRPRPLAHMPKFQPLKKRFYPITGWQLDEPWHSRLREKRERNTRPIFILAADWYSFRRLCFERAIATATWLQHPDDLANWQPGEVLLLATADSWRHPMWAHPKTEEYLWPK